jgi:hypothetical protein
VNRRYSGFVKPPPEATGTGLTLAPVALLDCLTSFVPWLPSLRAVTRLQRWLNQYEAQQASKKTPTPPK